MSEENKETKAQEVIKAIQKLLAENDLELIPHLQIIGNQVQHTVEIVEKPQEKRIITPETILKK